MVAMVGLILDGGAAFAHRRDEQTASDLAALAGANAFLVNYDQPLTRDAAAVAAALESARLNGYEHGVGGVTVDVAIDTTAGAQVTVDIDAPHENTFAKIVGMNSWQIATTATAITGFADTAIGAGPMLFNVAAFDTDDGTPLPLYGDKDHPFTFSHGQGQSGDAPGGAENMSWTDYSGEHERQHEHGPRDHPRRDVARRDPRPWPVHRPAQQRRSTPTSSKRSTPGWPAQIFRSRSSTRTASSRAGRPSTSRAPAAPTRRSPATSSPTSSRSG